MKTNVPDVWLKNTCALLIQTTMNSKVWLSADGGGSIHLIKIHSFHFILPQLTFTSMTHSKFPTTATMTFKWIVSSNCWWQQLMMPHLMFIKRQFVFVHRRNIHHRTVVVWFGHCPAKPRWFAIWRIKIEFVTENVGHKWCTCTICWDIV